MSITSIMVNYMFSKGDRERDAGLTTPDDVERKNNISYGPHRKYHLMDIYYPKQRTGKLPVIISVHGGGWVYGTKEVYQFYGMSLAQRGFAVVNFNYRLAPRYQYPSQLEDTNNVICWIYDHAEDYGLDLGNIFMVGDSAGAHMLSLYSCICTNPEYAKQYNFHVPEGFLPKAIALNCGVYDIHKAMAGNQQMEGLMKDFLGKRNYPSGLETINVIRYVTKDFPPVYLMTAEADFLKDQAPDMEEKLKEFGIPYEYKLYGDEQNQLQHVFHCNMRLADARECNTAECNFFRNYMTASAD